MIHLKTEKEIQVMIDGGKILKEVLEHLKNPIGFWENVQN